MTIKTNVFLKPAQSVNVKRYNFILMLFYSLTEGRAMFKRFLPLTKSKDIKPNGMRKEKFTM